MSQAARLQTARRTGWQGLGDVSVGRIARQEPS